MPFKRGSQHKRGGGDNGINLHAVLLDKTIEERLRFLIKYAHLHRAKLRREGRDLDGQKRGMDKA